MTGVLYDGSCEAHKNKLYLFSGCLQALQAVAQDLLLQPKLKTFAIVRGQELWLLAL